MSVEDYRQGLFESKQETLREFRDAWEEFQGEFYKAADLDPAHGGCYLITADRWRAVSRIVNAVIGKGQHVTVDALVAEAESTPEGKALMDEARAELKPKLDALHAAMQADAARWRWCLENPYTVMHVLMEATNRDSYSPPHEPTLDGVREYFSREVGGGWDAREA